MDTKLKGQNLSKWECSSRSELLPNIHEILGSIRSREEKVVSIREVAINEHQFLKKDLSITKHNEKRRKLNPSVLVTFSHHLIQDPMVNLRKC